MQDWWVSSQQKFSVQSCSKVPWSTTLTSAALGQCYTRDPICFLPGSPHPAHSPPAPHLLIFGSWIKLSGETISRARHSNLVHGWICTLATEFKIWHTVNRKICYNLGDTLAICSSEYMMWHLHFWADSINGRLMEKLPLYFLLANENTSKINTISFILFYYISLLANISV